MTFYNRHSAPGRGIGPASPAMRDKVRSFMSAVQDEVYDMPTAHVRAIAPALRAAQRELERDLSRWLAQEAGDPKDRYTAHKMRTALRQIRASLKAMGEVVPALKRTLRIGNVNAAGLSNAVLTKEISRLAQVFGATDLGALTPIPLKTAAQLAEKNKWLIRRFDASVARYGESALSKIRHHFQVGLLKGETLGQMTKRIARLGGMPWRGADIPADAAMRMAGGLLSEPAYNAERLIRSELAHAYNVHHQEAIDEVAEFTPGMKKRWDGTNDFRLCPLCRELDGEVVGHGEEFPGGFQAPPRHPNCRCVLVPWMDDWPEVKPLTPPAEPGAQVSAKQAASTRRLKKDVGYVPAKGARAR